ncbi:MAG: phenylalanine--tRNA ligase subunit alpha [Candidatus Paceibacterota bacterium]|jgi:phenylalanyl-tRNA synthetase alpha chain
MDIKNLIEEAKKEIEKAGDLNEMDMVFRKYLGKTGAIRNQFLEMKNLTSEERGIAGQELNSAKNEIETAINEKMSLLRSVELNKKESEVVDVTLPGKKFSAGHLHPLTLNRRRMEEIFSLMGFEVAEGPEIEDEWHNFDALNILPQHPARDALSLGKTFYLTLGGLLRTHTSPVQIRFMESHQPPFRIIIPGRVYRAESTDSSHEVQFHQIEGLMVGKDVSVANFKAIFAKFLQEFFGKEMKIRLRPSYFPFTEPSFEVDMSCAICGGKGCPACKQSGWVEFMGAGMVHPNVLKNGGLDPNDWQGFAFGMSLDRLTMMKHKINNIRLFQGNDLRFLKQF